MDIEFYWNREYHFDPQKKYLVYYRGCFCPCTAGHLALVEPFLKPENVTVFISQLGTEKRHGVPFEVSRSIWQSYIEHCIEPKDRVILTKLHKGSEDIKPYLDGVDRVLYLMGIEHASLMGEPTRRRTRRRRRRREKKKILHDRERLIGILKRRNIGLDFIMVDRPHKKTLSATQFVRAVKRGDSFEKLRYYMPDTLPPAAQREIVAKLRAAHLH